MLKLDINLLFTVLNILIWYVLIRKFLFKPVNAVIRKREELIAGQYAQARQLQEQADAEKEKYIQMQAKIEEEKAASAAAAREAARAEYDRIVAEAAKKADQLLEKSRKDAELEKSRIVGKAEQEIRSLILDTVVTSLSSPGSDKAVYDQFLTKAGETHAE